MLAFGPYLAAVITAAVFVGAVALVGLRLRALILPAWDGARARLAEIVLMVGTATTLCLTLGTFSLLNRPSLLLAAIALSASVEWRFRRRDLVGGPEEAVLPAQAPWSRLAALAVATVVTAHWGIGVSWSLDAGITNFDSVWYHLPFSAEMAQSGSTLNLVRTETVFLNWLYPQGSELLHAAGMVLTERDLASLAMNLGWLGLAFLAAWCIGRPYGRGHLTVAAAAVLLECHNVVARVPGTAKNDIMAVALLMAATALLINFATPGARSGSDPSFATEPDDSASDSREDRRSVVRVGELGPGWPLALAALAVGLAAGTKVTALVPAAGLTLAALAACPAGARMRASLWWSGGLVVGGAYWYLRNIIVAGNPLPQITQIGPIGLPGPDRLQTGRPDFTVFHYLFDGPVWRDYLIPGLERGFGSLWPLLVGAAIAGGFIAASRLARRRPQVDRLLPWLGLAALFGMAAYLFTPLSAAGPEGSPTAFAINLRFAIPSLMLGLVLLPLLLPVRSRPGVSWAVFAGLVVVCLVTNGADATLTDSGRLFGWALAIGLIVLPALTVYLATGQMVVRRASPALGLVGLVAAIVICYPLQRSYFEHRYADFAPEQGLSEVYRWASERSDARIGLAGTTAGFHGFGFYGVDLSNKVAYIGEQAPRAGFNAIQSCPEFRRAVNQSELDYLVTSPFLNFMDVEAPIPSPERRWVAHDPAVRAELEQGAVTLWRLTGKLDERCGGPETPHRELPDSPAGSGRDTGTR